MRRKRPGPTLLLILLALVFPGQVTFAEQGMAIARAIHVLPYGPEAFDDGPYVFWQDPSTAVVVCIVNGEVTRSVVKDITEPVDVPTPCKDVPKIHLDPNSPQPIAASWPMPSRMLAVSDLEGNYQTFVKFLKANGVIDADGHWAWGDGHLVLNGDIVDRGDQVTEILWLIRRLEREADAAGGKVHYVLGNHETMVMAGDLRYIHPKYALASEEIGKTYHDLYGPDTELGRWLRSKNAIVRIGNVLFVHAGYSPALDELGLDVDEINQRIRSTIGPPAWPTRDQLGPHLIWHQNGPMWYRGYFEKYAESWGGSPTPEQIDSILKRNEVDHIVVGHTVVEDIGWLGDNKQLIGIDVKWSKPEEGEGLLFENDTITRVDMNSKRKPLNIVHKPNSVGIP